MNKLLLMIPLLLGVTSLKAQDYKFGKVSMSDLESVDTTSVATVLYKKQTTYYDYRVDDGFVLITEFEKKIKINKKEGFKYANITVDLYDELATKKEIINGLKGATYNLINGKIEKTKLRTKEVFEEKYNKYWKKIKITFPKVLVGSVIDVKYHIESPFVHELKDVVLQEEIPVREFDYQINIPEYYTFSLHENIKSNYQIKLINDSKYVSKNIKWKEKVNQAGGYVLKEFERTLNYQDKIIKFNEKNIPPLIGEDYSVALNSYVIKLGYDLKSTKSFNDLINEYASDWDLITKKIYENDNFGGELNKNTYFKNEIDDLITDNSSDEVKINTLLRFIRTKVKWNGFNDYFPDMGLKAAYKKGKGNVADINLMLIAMLRYVGLSANPILVSTKSNGEPLYSTRQGFNYVICGVEISNDVLLIDATEQNTSINILPERALNWQGRIIREHGSSYWVNLFPTKNSSNTTILSVTLDKNLTFKGKVRSQKTDYYAYNYRNNYVGLTNEVLIKSKTEGKGEIEISNLVVKNERSLNKPIQQTYDFIYEDGLEEIGAEVYVSPMLFLSKTKNMFNSEKRTYPIDFNFPFTKKNVVNLSIPDGYKVKSLPDSLKLTMSDNLGAYEFLVLQKGKTIQISEVIRINFSIIPVSYYPELKELFGRLVGKNAEKIVLEKI